MSIEKMLKETIEMNGFTDHPMLSHICDNLYVGMSPFYWPHSHEEFYNIYNLYTHKFYQMYSHQKLYTVQILDSEEELIPRGKLVRLANQITIDRKNNPVLIHCQMGVNRSNLLAALALMLGDGMTAKDAILLLKKKRSPYVLLNNHFTAFLYRFNKDL